MESNPESGSESSPEPQPSQPDGGPAPAPSDGVESPVGDESNADSSKVSDPQLPDAASLVAMAAMHIGTTDLIRVLVGIFDAHAWRAMGLVADHSGEVRKDMA